MKTTNVISFLIATIILTAVFYWPVYLVTVAYGPIIGYLFFTLAVYFNLEIERQRKLERMRDMSKRINDYVRSQKHENERLDGE